MANTALSFKARIRYGAAVFQDFGMHRWPLVKADGDIMFRVTQDGVIPDNFKCVAPGYGEIGGDYGNGCLLLSDMNDLLIDDNHTRLELLSAKRARLQKEYRKKAEEMRDLNQQIARLSHE